MLLLQSLHWQLPLKRAFLPCRPFLLWHDHIRFLFHPLTVFCQLRFVGLGEDAGVLGSPCSGTFWGAPYVSIRLAVNPSSLTFCGDR